jgi:hypothetical protein
LDDDDQIDISPLFPFDIEMRINNRAAALTDLGRSGEEIDAPWPGARGR